MGLLSYLKIIIGGLVLLSLTIFLKHLNPIPLHNLKAIMPQKLKNTLDDFRISPNATMLNQGIQK